MALVDVDWLRARLGDPRVVDCRWRLAEPGAGRRLYEEGHIPGAAFMDVDADLSAPPGRAGRHPLPAAEDFERAARRAGIGGDSHVVAYDDGGPGGAARLWWLLRHFGHERADVLDGGMRAWAESGGPLEQAPPARGEGDFEARPRADDTIAAA